MSPSTTAPAGGFDILPNPSDVSIGADLARIKFYRNEVAHSADARMDINKFNSSWTDVEGVIGRLGGSSLLNETNALRFSPIDESEKELLLELKQLSSQQSETVPWNVRELMKEKIESWEVEEQVFVEIKASAAVENFIKDHPCVVLVGHPGSGKSALIHHIALKMEKEEGFSIIPFERPDEIMKYSNRRDLQVFVVDDPCGEYSVNDLANEWNRYSETIKKCLNFNQSEDQVQSKLLVSCRLDISTTRTFRRIKLFSNALFSLENQENRLTVIEKEKILKSHLKRDLHCRKDLFERHIDCFPLLCKLYVTMWVDTDCYASFFDNPYIHLVSKLDLFIDNPKPETVYEYCSLVCCSLAEHKLALYLSNSEQNVDFACLHEIHNACDVDLNPSELLAALNRQVGKYVRQVGTQFSLIHSKLLDIIVWHFGKQSPETLIKFSSLEIFQNRLRPLGRLQDDDNQDLFLVELDENMLPFYTKRIQKDISQGNINDIFKNPCMPNAQIETSLFDLLVDQNGLNETLLKRNFSLPLANIEAYTFLSKEDLLENGQLTCLHLIIVCNWATFLEKLFESRNSVLLKTMFDQRASTLHLAILSENIQIVQRCFQNYSEVFGSISEFMDFGIKYDTSCLFCCTTLTDSNHQFYCPVAQVPIPLLVCISGKLEILEYLIQNRVYSRRDFISEYQLFNEAVTPLMVTSLYGHCNIVRYLLQHGASANYQNKEGISPLHEACQNGHLEVSKILLSNEANVNFRDFDGETPLSLACRNDFIEIVDYLLCNGADINLQDSQGLTPIHKAISEGHIRTVQFLIERGCDISIASKRGDTPLSLACFIGDIAIFKLFIEKGIKRQQLQDGMRKACVKGNKNIISILLELGGEINSRNAQGLSALHISCAQNNSDLVTYLFSKGAVANIQSDDKKTPLHFAAKHLSVKCLLILLQNKAEINAIDDKGRTALHYALTDFDGYFSKKLEMEIEHGGKHDIFQDSTFAKEMPGTEMKINSFKSPVNVSEKRLQTNQEALKKLKRITVILIENKIDLNTVDIDFRSLLHTACSGNFSEIVKILIQNKVNVNSSDKDDCTPLHIACFKCHLLPVQLLIENGGNINATDVHGSSPLHLACVIGNLELVSTLVKYGAKVNIPDKAGSTSVHIAVKNTRRDVIDFLISKGANINARDNYGLTPLILCCCQNYKEVVEIFLRFGADIDIEISKGVNAVAMAIKYHHYDISDILFEKGAHLYENNFRYLLQCFINANDICKFLDKYGSAINKYRNKKGQSILHLATLNNNSCWVRNLLNKTELFKEVDNKGQTAFVYAIYSEFASIINLFLERCTSGDAITADLQKSFQRGHIFLVETLFKITRLQFDEFEMVFDSGNHDIVRKFMRGIRKCNLGDFTTKYCSPGCDKIIVESLKHCKYFDMYNIILAKLPDEIWNVHKSTIPCLFPERGETSCQNWIRQEEDIDKSYKTLTLNPEIFKLEIWPLLFLRKDFDIHKIMQYIFWGFLTHNDNDLDLLSITDAIGNSLLHYCVISDIRENLRHHLICELVNRQNLAGCTPLHYAVESPFHISVLIEMGADIEIKDNSERDVLYYAKACNLKKTVEILERHLTKISSNSNMDI